MNTEEKDIDEVLYDINEHLLNAQEEYIAEIANKICTLNYSWDYSRKKFIVTDVEGYYGYKKRLLELAQKKGLVDKNIPQSEIDNAPGQTGQLDGLWNDFILSEFFNVDDISDSSMIKFINSKMPPIG